jgi:hypothetical protein
MEKISPAALYLVISGAAIVLSVAMYVALGTQLGQSNWDCWASSTSKFPAAVGGLKDYVSVTTQFEETIN